MISKGAVEEMLSLCKYALDPGDDHSLHIENDNIIPLDDLMKEKSSEVWKTQCRRTSCFTGSIREFEGNHPLNYSVADENNLILRFYWISDPAKPSAEPSIKALHKLGIEVKVITGDMTLLLKKYVMM